MHVNNYDYVADIYDIYNQSDYDIGFYLDQYKGFKGKSIELMAGTGRLSIPLLKSGMALDCVDISKGLLNQLQAKLDKDSLKAEIIQSDIRYMSLKNKYDLVIIGFNSFSEIIEQQDQELVLRSIYNSMNDTGEFVFSLYNSGFRRKFISASLSLVNEYDAGDNKILFFMASKENENAIVDIVQLYEFYDQEGNQTGKKMLKLRFKLITKEAIETMLFNVGFRIKALYGDYQRNPFYEDKSPFMIYVLNK